jgi:hypothetical protein
LPARAGNFDGSWSVELSTENGQCGLNYKGQISVSNGRINEDGLFVQAAGLVDRAGKVTLRVSRGSDWLSASGALTAQNGSGRWAAHAQPCSGRWRATRL